MPATYRVDTLRKNPKGVPYKTPCGMNSLVFLGARHPSIRELSSIKKKHLSAGMVGVISVYRFEKRDYEVLGIISNGFD